MHNLAVEIVAEEAEVVVVDRLVEEEEVMVEDHRILVTDMIEAVVEVCICYIKKIDF